MSVHHTSHGINFVWDSHKSVVNLAKHGVTFDIACEVFFDPMILAIDEEVVDHELREHVIGMTVNWQILYVIYTICKDTVRIISARSTEPHERRYYEDQ